MPGYSIISPPGCPQLKDSLDHPYLLFGTRSQDNPLIPYRFLLKVFKETLRVVLFIQEQPDQAIGCVAPGEISFLRCGLQAPQISLLRSWLYPGASIDPSTARIAVAVSLVSAANFTDLSWVK